MSTATGVCTDKFLINMMMTITSAGPDGHALAWKMLDDIAPEFNKPYNVLRFSFAHFFGWAIPSEEAINLIVELANSGKILSIGSGNCFWEFLMAGKGATVIATDINVDTLAPPFHPLIQMDAIDAINKFTDAVVLFMCWPKIESAHSIEKQKDALSKFSGKYVVFVGEAEGSTDGCTPCEMMDVLFESGWKGTHYIDIPRWKGFHDEMCVYERETDPS
jgi:hypothetical protein